MKNKYFTDEKYSDDESELFDEDSMLETPLNELSSRGKRTIDVRRQLEDLLEKKRLRKEMDYDFDINL
jgi:hypothetical protein